ncbi:MAG: hypothetical protein ACT4OI_09765 [Methanobacteriota archaeon]
MPWAMETKAGFGWAIAVTLVFLGTIWAIREFRSLAVLVVPVVVYLAFFAWLGRVK